MMRYRLLVVTLFVLLAASATPRVTQAADSCFTETDQCFSGRFQQFWNGNGGLPVFGFPVGEQRTEQGTQGAFVSQWFERERFEAHPENKAPYDVLLGRLGDELLRRQGRDWYTFPKGQQTSGCQYFAETEHTLCEPFLSYWKTRGLEFDGHAGKSYSESLALFGLPLSEPAVETNSSGATVLTQWFERARFEYVPTNPDPYKVLLGRLGAEAFDPTAGNGPLHYHQVQAPGWPHPLEVPVGFTIEEVASDIPSPRFMALDPSNGSLVYGSATTNQVVRLIDTNNDERYDQQQIVAGGLAAVHSVAFVDGQLYAAAEDQLVRLSNFDANGAAKTVEKLLDLPGGAKDLYGHRTRTLAQGPDGKLYLSVGSSCDVCIEDTPLRAALLRMNIDGGGVEVYASGLRNTVGFDWRPFTSELWGADMGRNNIGAGIPHDELDRIEQGRTYGWPYCYDDKVPNPEYNDPSKCANTTSPTMNFPAHWAPLGFMFYKGTNFPASYQGDALVAMHGTASDQVGDQLSGYNVTRVRFKNGQPVGMEDLVRGWLVDGKQWGRPAGLLTLPDGSVLISDDASSRIYRLRYVGA